VNDLLIKKQMGENKTLIQENNELKKRIQFIEQEYNKIKKMPKKDLLSENDLKNKNNILESEIKHYKNNPVYKTPYTQYDSNLNNFIEELRNALDNTQMSNNELREVILKLQNSNENLSDSNLELIRNYEITKEELEKVIKENSNLKGSIMLKDEKINELNFIIDDQKKSMSQMEEMLLTNEKKINYLKTVENSSKQTENDNEVIINNLKETIENLQKNGNNYDEDINKLNEKIYDYMELINEREKIIDNLNNEIQVKNNEIDDFNNKIKEKEKIINKYKVDSMKSKNDYQEILFDNEKLKAQIESFKLLLKDREKTIDSLKKSVSFLSKTFDNNLKLKIINKTEESSNVPKNQNEKNNKYVENLEYQIKKLKEENSELKNENKKYENEYNEYINQFEQNKYDYQLLYKKYKEQENIIENLKENFSKNRKDNELEELIKKNQQIMEKLKLIQEENENKNNELSILKKNYDRVNNILKEKEINEIKREIKEKEYKEENNSNIYIENNNSEKKNDEENNEDKNENNNFNTESSNYIETKINTENLMKSNLETETIKKEPNPNLIFSINKYKKIISFDLGSKQFDIIKPIDKTSTLKNNFWEVILNNNYSINCLNTENGLFIIINNLIFFYESSSNSIYLFSELKYSHNKCSSILIKNDIYIISGENTLKCEKCNLENGIISNVPNVNYEKSFCGLCNIGNNYLYTIFGYNCICIEKLKLSSNYNNNISWEIVKYNNEIKFTLQNFICFVDDYMNIVIFGGQDSQQNLNYNIYSFDIGYCEFSKKGKIDNSSLFSSLPLQITDNLFLAFDLNGNIHVYNREIDIHSVYEINENFEE
jgi:N-terminal acetyltransferase B complex non-catalytic subunit